MIKHGWSVICERTIIDNTTNNVSLINCIEQVTCSTLPVVLPQFSLCSYFYNSAEKSSNKLTIRMKLKNPDGSDNILAKAPLSIDMKKTRQRIKMELSGIMLKQAGIYYFSIEQKNNNSWKTIAELPLELVYKPQ
ncbi:MAG: hypothetical protein ABIE74_02240 [Pseudomonadota bacterium]